LNLIKSITYKNIFIKSDFISLCSLYIFAFASGPGYRIDKASFFFKRRKACRKWAKLDSAWAQFVLLSSSTKIL